MPQFCQVYELIASPLRQVWAGKVRLKLYNTFCIILLCRLESRGRNWLIDTIDTAHMNTEIVLGSVTMSLN